MNKKRIYIIAIIFFCAAIAGIIIHYTNKEKQDENKEYTLLPRKGAAGNTAEFKDVQKRANDALLALQKDPNDVKALLRLAALYIQEARETGNYVYYDMAAMRYVNRILVEDPQNFNGLVFKALIYMSQHHFADGLVTAHEAQLVNPNNAYVYGLLVDGYVEMGRYDSAVINSDKMVSIRPDLTSYSRISYIREIYGDYPGAIQAMKLAVNAGGRGDEHTEWTRVQLGSLFEKTNNYVSADSLYNMSLTMRPSYPYALAGLARIAITNNNYTQAIAYYTQADSIVDDNALKTELEEVYRLAGQKDKADALANDIVAGLSKNAQAGNNNENIGHYADRELAYAYLKINDIDKALEHALLEYNRRPENIDVNETVAWVYYKKGDYVKALPYIKTALKTHSKNPVLLCRAALIYFKTGDKAMAKTLLSQTTVTNPYIGHPLIDETAAMMKYL